LLKGIYPFGTNIYQKLPIYATLVAVSLRFKATAAKFVVRVQNLETLHNPNFVKKIIYQKLSILAILGAAITF